MSASRAAAPSRRVRPAWSWALRGATAASLGVSAYLHVVLAQGPLLRASQVTVAGLFLAQAAAATTGALAVLLRPAPVAWVLAALVGLGSLAALVLSVYVQIPAFGPIPSLYEPAWYSDKVLAAASAAVAAGCALAGLVRARARR